jgi:hypothetical protein
VQEREKRGDKPSDEELERMVSGFEQRHGLKDFERRYMKVRGWAAGWLLGCCCW